ncbi:hypothetical protein BUALT_Bualt10G0025100 [Buddleja alternifolia]|uniref:Disease resistance protein winged helix domain-containing protein n=1 Tax=Buddleja alternifolia TaxID=168488 RepID=A0AAV6WWZ3_9LAMI|nr:hypothetical protein BUALT_Bualt10G0025100 [Buddleja alternifolia]
MLGAKKVFDNETCPPQLLDVGNQIAASCCGLPLAVVVVAGILSSMDREKSTWENVGGILASYIFGEKNNSTMQILELSYKHLPDHLKPCFLILEHREIPIRKLKRLWIAERFIRKHERKSLESVAEEYLMELIGKSLIIVTGKRSDGGVKINYSIYGKHQRMYAPLHSVSLNPIYNASHLILGRYGRHVRSFIGYLLMPPLNVVSTELLKSLGLLEYKLWRLGCKVSISSSLLKLAKLRYLEAREATFNEDCNSTQMVINNLIYLSTVCIFDFKDEEMLKCSTHLRKLKCICKPLLMDDEGILSYRYPDLRFLTHLESLKMTANSYKDVKAENINFPLNIKKLSLSWLRNDVDYWGIVKP